jgi:hypothetical protein
MDEGQENYEINQTRMGHKKQRQVKCGNLHSELAPDTFPYNMQLS